MTSDTIDCLLLGSNASKKMLGDPRDQKLVVSLLQNSLDTDPSKSNRND